MNKITTSILSLFLSVGVFAEIPAGYYSVVQTGQRGETIYQELKNRIGAHKVISYSNLEDYYEELDFDSEGYLMDIYSTCPLIMADGNKSQNGVCDAWNKEHTIPQSWFGESSPMKSDLFHVYPTDACVNGARSNYPYGETNATGLGLKSGKDPQNHGLGKVGTNTFGGYNVGKIYEPDDEFKGDLARTYFYMATRYSYNTFTKKPEGQKMFSAIGFTQFALELLLKWHRQDPVSEKEIKRNDGIYKIQGNRNPFIDYPYLVEYIWGSKSAESVDMDYLISSSDPRFEPGESDGYWGAGPSGLEQVLQEAEHVQDDKFIYDGGLYIRVADHLYDALGRRIQ